MGKNKIQSDAQGTQESDICLDDDLLFKYVDGRANKLEVKKVEIHVNRCSKCYHELTTLVKYALTPATEREENEIEKMRTFSEQEQVEKILAYNEQIDIIKAKNVTEKTLFSEKIKSIAGKVKDVISEWLTPTSSLKPVIAVACLVMLILFSVKGLHFYNTQIPVLKARKTLLQHYNIPIKTVRLSGGYEVAGIGIQLDNDESNSYLEDAEKRLNKAISKGNTSVEPKLLLAHFFLITNHLSEADSILKIIEEEAIHSAQIFNDIGVYYYQQRDWANAVNYFNSALQVDKNYHESYYNLALTKYKMEQYDDAKSAIDAYLDLEENEGWYRAGLSLKAEIVARVEG